jgi:hypothetical protein
VEEIKEIIKIYQGPLVFDGVDLDEIAERLFSIGV